MVITDALDIVCSAWCAWCAQITRDLFAIAKFLLFLPRDAMQARPMPSCGVCVSVCVTVAFVHSVKTNKDIFEMFSPSGDKPF